MVRYLAFYDTQDNRAEKRNIILAATNKLEYIFECMHKSDIKFDIISASGTLNKKPIRRKDVAVSDGVTLHLPASLGSSCAPVRVLDRLQIKFGLFLKLLKLKKTDTLIVYHSLFYMRTVSLAKRLRKFRLIIEAEEIYGDVIGNSRVSEQEVRFFKTADAYIFPTQLLNEKVNSENKPHIFIHGTYKVEKDRKCKFQDGKIHAVYAGTFDPRKGGGIAAAAAAAGLDFNYHIHIIGFGTAEEKKSMQDLVSKLAKTSECTVTYDGLLSGEEYIRFIQSCDIGLSTQNPDAGFNATSFPSKVLSYMANGLRVVSVRIPALERSAVGDMLYYYDENTPVAVAEAICSIDVNDGYDSRKVIEQLDLRFRKELKELVGD